MIEYRMKVHVFGNRPSPAVAAYGLKRTAEDSRDEFGEDVSEYIKNDFYVDDGLTSVQSDENAINLITRTQLALSKYGNLRLHKVASNSKTVLNSLPREDLAKELIDLDFAQSDMPIQLSLGVYWNIQSDSFTFRVTDETKPFTRRGVLPTINSIYDPIGFVAPVVITGKLILRDLLSESQDWEDPLPQDKLHLWQDWYTSLNNLNLIEIPRQYLPGVEGSTSKQLQVFCDASEKVIAAAAYIVTTSPDSFNVSFILGKAKVAPTNRHTIPRLELCAAVLATEVSNTVLSYIDISFDQVKYFSDSKVVLGCISNKTRRFYTYVSNRVQKILSQSTPQQWFYVPTKDNPADVGTRGAAASTLSESPWLKGPSRSIWSGEHPSDFPLVDPDLDQEIRVNVSQTVVNQQKGIDSQRFTRFSEWLSLKRAIACLQHIAEGYCNKEGKGWHVGCDTDYTRAELFIVKTVQQEEYSEVCSALRSCKSIPKDSPIVNLNPFLDQEGVLRVGGRINSSDLPYHEKHPIILPRKCHIATLILKHFHSEVKHQGRHFTEGTIRSHGYWIVSAKRLISTIIRDCVLCKILRGSPPVQIMADLPNDRIQPAPPFTYVGVDTFGPWNIVTRKTRGGQANSKRWAILFTCLTIRAIHIEVVEEMSSSAFTNALRRFISRFGNVKIFRSDRGTNFVGTVNELNMNCVNVEDGLVKNLLRNKDATWIFNPPHSPHMGGVWERLIGVVKRILNSILCDIGQRNLTHDVLVTVMAEICSIVNSRPIVPVSTDSSVPLDPKPINNSHTEV